MMAVAERIDQLGGEPNFNPEGLATRSASQYAEGENLVDMIRENLIAERIAMDHYRELIRYFGETTRHPGEARGHAGRRGRACYRHAGSAAGSPGRLTGAPSH